MKTIKRIIFTFLALLFILLLGILYDLAYYDSSYINRNAITFNKNNLNSKKIKRFFRTVEKNYYILKRTLYSEQKDYWKIEDGLIREQLPKVIKIEGKKDNFLTGTNLNKLEKNFSNWTRSHGGYSSMRFSSLKEINKSNVHKLKVAWVYKSNDGKRSIQANPVVNDGLIYFPTPGNFIVCLDAASGKEIWKYKVSKGFWAAKRGLLVWKDTKNKNTKLIFTNDDELIILDAKTGESIKSFGLDGKIKIGSTPTVPTIIDDELIVATIRPSIEVYDLNSGDLKWKFYLRNIDKDQVNHRDFIGGNPWGGVSADIENGIIYITTGNPAPYYVGVIRPGKNLYSNSIIAFDVRNKKILWYFQETCHDLWNFDIAAPPILTTINKDNRRIDVVVAVTKLGNTIILDKHTGEPIFDYEKRLAPTSKIYGEKTCAYQPSFKIPEPFSRNVFKIEDVTNKSIKDRKHVLSQVNVSNYGFFEPHEFNKYTITYNLDGGAQWTGASVDPYKNILYVSANEQAYKILVSGSNDLKKVLDYKIDFIKDEALVDSEGYPGIKPPWGTLTALNLNNGKIIWQVPLGYFPELKKRGMADTGTANFGGPTASLGGLVFIGGTLDKLIRAFDSDTGEELWSHKLPYIGSAPPTIYEANGEQYILIPATGGSSLFRMYPEMVESGDSYVAFKLGK
jgi:quinoprotein glucose dehydrogenase